MTTFLCLKKLTKNKISNNNYKTKYEKALNYIICPETKLPIHKYTKEPVHPILIREDNTLLNKK